MSEALAMGEYGAYVWSSFGITVMVLLICVVQGKRRHKSVFNELQIQIRAMESDT